MADPNASPVSNDTGTLSSTQLQDDLSQIDSTYDPQIKAEEQVSQADESQAVNFSNQGADEAQAAAKDATAQDKELSKWVSSTPTRQASYATTMHAAPVLSMLVALGGSLTKLTGGQMLAATTGIVQGLNAGAEQQYTDAYNAWMAGYKKLQEQHQNLMQAHSLMLESYKGRADAYQKAADAARRQTGDLLDQKQEALKGKIDLFKAQQEAMARMDRIKYSYEQLHERQIKDLAEIGHWKQIDGRANGADPRTKAQIGAAKQRFTAAKAQVDELMKLRGQVNGNLTMKDEDKATMLASIDAKVDVWREQMNESTREAEQIASSIPATGASPQAAAPPPLHPASPPAAKSQGQQLSPGKMAALKQHMGKPVKFGDGTEAIMKQDGTVQVIGGNIDRTVH
jgi:hypothetical protein